jgi:hypothetical protein
VSEWFEWRHVMPALTKNYTVIVPDLRGALRFFKAGYRGGISSDSSTFKISMREYRDM